MKLGTLQASILRTVANGDWYDSSAIAPAHHQRPGRKVAGTGHDSCLKLNAYKLLRRDPNDSYRWTATEAGTKAIRKHDADLARRLALPTDWAPETKHERDCAYVVSDGPAPCTCIASTRLVP